MSSTAAHATFSPSSFPRLMRCSGSFELSKDEPDSTSEFADEGTAAHQLAAWTLESAEKSAYAFQGRILRIVNGQYWDGTGDMPPTLVGCSEDIDREYEADAEMCEYVQRYVDSVLEMLGGDDQLFVEQRVSISHVVGLPDQFGTSDAIVLREDSISGCELQVHDLKYGKGVRVDADHNEQLMMYALGALERYSVLMDFDSVRVVIHQPRLAHISEWSCSIEQLLEFGRNAQLLCSMIQEGRTVLNPGEKQCKFCKAKGSCPAYRDFVLGNVADDFVDLDGNSEAVEAKIQNGIERVRNMTDAELDQLYPIVDLIADWPKAILAKIDGRLQAGATFKNCKLVAGKRGARRWVDEKEAEKRLKSMRFKQTEMYDMKLISPTTAEKRTKNAPKRWARLQDIIAQTEGKPSVAPVDDKRPALEIAPVADDFEDLI